MNRRLLALGLILCILLSGCNLFSDSEPDEPDPAVPEEPADDAPQDDPDTETDPVEPLPLPVTGGVDWNDAPAQSVGEGGTAPDEAVRPVYTYSVVYDFCTSTVQVPTTALIFPMSGASFYTPTMSTLPACAIRFYKTGSTSSLIHGCRSWPTPT